MPTLKLDCRKCKYINKRQVSYIDPKLYTDPTRASVKLGFWCKKCGTNTGVEYKCPTKDTAVELGRFNPTPNYSKIRIDPTREDDAEEWFELEELVNNLNEDEVIEVAE